MGKFEEDKRPRIYHFVFLVFPKIGEWAKVSGFIIPRLNNVKVKACLQGSGREEVVR